jgi:hypothetical protein
VTKEYGKEIIAEGSRSVMGLEDHIDKMIAEILDVDSSIVTVAREWRKVIERAAMTEGIDRVKSILGQEVNYIVAANNELRAQGDKSDIEMIHQSDSSSIDSNTSNLKMEVERSQLLENREIEESLCQMEEVQETKEEEISTTNREQQYTTSEESEEDILPAESDSSLERSIWAPSKDKCERKGTIRAKVAAIKVLGNNEKHRERSLRWSIGRNVHLKNISEKFEHGNLWCIVTFDCLKGYEEAKEKLGNKKEEYEQANLLLEENEEQKELNEIVEDQDTRNLTQEGQETKREREKQAEKELKEVFVRRGEKAETSSHEQDLSKRKETTTYQAKKNFNPTEDNNKITVWDLPAWARRTQVFEIVRFLGRVEHIEMIKSASDKTRAEVEFKTGTLDKKKINGIWCLPFANEILVRISTGTNNLSLLRTRNRFSKRLLDLPENTNEVLLWRQIKRSGAKALHIFKNSNNNNMRSATVYFEKEEDMLICSKFSLSYYDNKLRWANSTRYEANIKSEEDKNSEEPEAVRRSNTRSSKTRRYIGQDQEVFRGLIPSEEEITSSIERTGKTTQTSAYSEKKRREIREGKKKEANYEASSSIMATQKQISGSEKTYDYMLQLIRSLEEKIQHMEWEAPNRS